MKYALLQCWMGGNNVIADCHAPTKEEAIKILKPRCPVPLDKEGYGKYMTLTFTVAEYWNTCF